MKYVVSLEYLEAKANAILADLGEQEVRRRCEALRDQPLRILEWREVQKRWKSMQNKRQERARLQAAMAPANETATGTRWSGRGPSAFRSFTFTDLRFP